MRKLFWLFLLWLPLAGVSASNTKVYIIKGQIFEDSISKSQPAFLYENRRELKDDNQTTRTRFSNLKGESLVEEEIQYEKGELKKYTYQQRQVDEGGSIEIKEGKVFYRFVAQGKLYEDSHELEPNSLVPDMVALHIAKNWDALMKGESVKIRFLLLERQESIGFKFFKEKEYERQGKNLVDIIMKPSSIFIAAVAPSLRFTVEKNAPHRLVESFGRLPVRIPEVPEPKKRKDWRAIDALMTLELPTNL